MSTPYLQSYLLVLEDGTIETWSGYAEDKSHGEGLAIDYVICKHNQQIWDMCCLPVTEATTPTEGYS